MRTGTRFSQQTLLRKLEKSLGNMRAGEHCFLHISLSIVVVLVISNAECVDVRKGLFFHLPLGQVIKTKEP